MSRYADSSLSPGTCLIVLEGESKELSGHNAARFLSVLENGLHSVISCI